MQTFLPYPDLRASSQVLDDRRLGKQRVETFQILRALTWPAYAWKNHPAVRMWRGFVPALVAYGLENCREWTRRGYADTVAPQLLDWSGGTAPTGYDLPPWFGAEPLHLSHRSALLRKDPAYYRPLFDRLGHEGEPDDLPYLWPPDVFPRWPVRRGSAPLTLSDAVTLLGYSSPRPGQAEAALAVQGGHDALLVMRPGRGGSAAGLLAGLLVPGRTLWVRPPEPSPAPPAPRVPLVPLVPRRQVAAADRPPPLARAAQPEDRAAMQAETEPPQFCFVPADRLPPLDAFALVVVDHAEQLSDAEAGGLRGTGPRPPLLVVTDRADAAQRARLLQRFGLREAVHAGGGWDPADGWLGVEQVMSAAARRRALERLVGEHGPAVVVTSSRDRADRLVAALAASGLRAAAWAPTMRAERAAAAVGAWRSRRLDALTLPAGALPSLGRARVRLLVGDAVGGLEQWRALVEQVSPASAVLLAGADAPAEVATYASAEGCRRAGLLEVYGEPVTVPCGRCDWCAPGAGPQVVAQRGAH
jgi:hypothetical protein